ncbi:MAG: sugar ABC transporter substrate-binding protein [Armatimonadetes bacterium]|nr:sugar ABC transporter substrate-binding protein [Armatimonadota bacterium]
MTVWRATWLILVVALVVALLPLSSSVAQPRPTLNLVSMSDRFSGALTRMAPEFERETGIKVNVTIQSYAELYSRAIADFVGRTGGADLYTVDIVWTGEWGENGYLLDLTPMIQRDRAAIAYDDVFPSVWKLGGWQGKQYAFPLAAYAGVLAYNKKVLTDAGIKPPRSVPEFAMAIQKLTGDGRYGIVMNGARGAPCAQDWMYHMLIHGGSILDKEGMPALNTPVNVRALTFFADMFKYAPPGATSYAWGDRELAFRSGVAMMQIAWSTGVRAHRDPSMSKVATISDITTLPQAAGAPTRYPLGGWSIGINRDSRNKEAAWQFIKWITSQRMRREFVRLGGEPIRRSETSDSTLLAEFPWFAMVGKSFENADGDFRPRIRQYPRIQDILGLEVNLVITGQKSPKAALDDAQAKAMPLFGR